MLFVLSLAWLVFLTIFVIECLRAPFGYEDARGFHFSNPPQLPSVTRKPAIRRPTRRVHPAKREAVR